MRVIKDDKRIAEKLMIIEISLHALISVHQTLYSMLPSTDALLLCLKLQNIIVDYKIEYDSVNHLKISVKPSINHDMITLINI